MTTCSPAVARLLDAYAAAAAEILDRLFLFDPTTLATATRARQRFIKSVFDTHAEIGLSELDVPAFEVITAAFDGREAQLRAACRPSAGMA